MTDKLAQLSELGVSIWLDDVSRSGSTPATSPSWSATSTSSA